jgi:hypothetical protein
MKLRRGKSSRFFEKSCNYPSSKNTSMRNPSLRSLRPLRETHSVSFPEHFPTPNSEEPRMIDHFRLTSPLRLPLHPQPNGNISRSEGGLW